LQVNQLGHYGIAGLALNQDTDLINGYLEDEGFE
jgi:hypothetical protein